MLHTPVAALRVQPLHSMTQDSQSGQVTGVSHVGCRVWRMSKVLHFRKRWTFCWGLWLHRTWLQLLPAVWRSGLACWRSASPACGTAAQRLLPPPLMAAVQPPLLQMSGALPSRFLPEIIAGQGSNGREVLMLRSPARAPKYFERCMSMPAVLACSDPDAALQSAEAEAAALCGCLLSRAPPLGELSAALSQRHSTGGAGNGVMRVEQLASLWPALLQAASSPHSAAAESQDLSNILQVPGSPIVVWLLLDCLSCERL
jgi:hypothetical protein